MAEKKTSCNVIPCGYDNDSFVFISYAHQDAEVVFPIIEHIEVSGVPKRMIEDGALVGLFLKNSGRGNHDGYEPVRSRDKHMSFNAPGEPGEYEIQARINDQILDAPTLVIRIPFTVLKPAAAATAEDAQ